MKGSGQKEWSPDLGLAILAATTVPPHGRDTVAAYMGVTRERVRQIEETALKKLRHPCRIRKLR